MFFHIERNPDVLIDDLGRMYLSSFLRGVNENLVKRDSDGRAWLRGLSCVYGMQLEEDGRYGVFFTSRRDKPVAFIVKGAREGEAIIEFGLAGEAGPGEAIDVEGVPYRIGSCVPLEGKRKQQHRVTLVQADPAAAEKATFASYVRWTDEF